MPADANLLDVGLLVARQGFYGALTVVGTGLVTILLGSRAFRPTAALFAAGGGVVAAQFLIAKFDPKLPASQGLVLATVALLLAVWGLLGPGVATVLGALGYGLVAGSWVSRHVSDPDLALAGGAVAFAIIAAGMWTLLPRVLPGLFGGLLTGLGLWGLAGASGRAPELFRTPVIWVAVCGVCAIVGAATGVARHKLSAAKADRDQAKQEADAKRRREQEDRARYARYME